MTSNRNNQSLSIQELLEIGDQYFEQEQYHKAISYYSEVINNKAIKKNLNLYDAYNKRGLTKLIIGLCFEAVKDFTIAIKLNPNYADSYFYRGIAYARLGYYKEAVDNFAQINGRNPKNKKAFTCPSVVYALTNQGLLYMNISKFKNVSSQNILIAKGISNILESQYEKALQNFDDVIWENPLLPDAYYYRAICYIALKQYDRAFNNFLKGLLLDKKQEMLNIRP